MKTAAILTGLVCAALLAGWTLWMRHGRLQAVEKRIPSIMGTETLIKAVVPEGDTEAATAAIAAAESELRAVDARMSTWIGTTELSRFNSAPVGKVIPLSPETLRVLRAALNMGSASSGAFDPTCRPILMLWKNAEQSDTEPTLADLAGAVNAVGFGKIRLHPQDAEKLADGLSVDLGGIAKGFAVDQAVEAMRKHGVLGGLVQCGGDLRTFGVTEGRGPWRIGVKRPSADAAPLLPEALLVHDRAVSTSGDTERYYTVQGRRRSHIVDPRTGVPVAASPMVVAVGPRGIDTDGWSTALSVMGPEGLAALPAGLEAMVLTRTATGYGMHHSPGFATFIEQPKR